MYRKSNKYLSLDQDLVWAHNGLYTVGDDFIHPVIPCWMHIYRGGALQTLEVEWSWLGPRFTQQLILRNWISDDFGTLLACLQHWSQHLRTYDTYLIGVQSLWRRSWVSISLPGSISANIASKTLLREALDWPTPASRRCLSDLIGFGGQIWAHSRSLEALAANPYELAYAKLQSSYWGPKLAVHDPLVDSELIIEVSRLGSC